MLSENSCIFCRIIAGTLPATVVDQNDDVIVIKDIYPKAPIHYLIIPRKHIVGIQSLEAGDVYLMGSIALMAQKLSTQLKDSPDFRLLENDGPDAGQSVGHLHFHFLSGAKMGGF